LNTFIDLKKEFRAT